MYERRYIVMDQIINNTNIKSHERLIKVTLKRLTGE